ncbi:hypothetical protein EA772_14030 [Pedobacter sp. G11]|uniref:hypothetical protein n=1 Tax=Pedobacter sp. G11 TaxID=2482728 RepID=UPI000F5F4BC4|nr:hypothetical protein [Pedobacter sp. G11]AZI26401.1 hypothetical protein EA772_14030 [Pedobacter sp. G11]
MYDSTILNGFEAILYGAVKVLQAFLELLRKAEQPLMISVSSSIGTLALHGYSDWQYYENANLFSFKAALNMYSITLAYQLL